ncbi:hypothetical protein P7L53_10175 [Thermoleptolyngbya sichuanensis XZ-Cy5]|uniref:hypothetical protein n=1 Tax=Thermoleptolyngbya sichuanensis TaxID=2885951 RepID=UPI00240D25A2|nr:hypothetical protein [Thermoleptolyngbya sichuanensis]MDG2616610.1 hypothetical protein [Thermoleptolyngbya sichuanensis XZ-Cy5]
MLAPFTAVQNFSGVCSPDPDETGRSPLIAQAGCPKNRLPKKQITQKQRCLAILTLCFGDRHLVLPGLLSRIEGPIGGI